MWVPVSSVNVSVPAPPTIVSSPSSASVVISKVSSPEPPVTVRSPVPARVAVTSPVAPEASRVTVAAVPTFDSVISALPETLTAVCAEATDVSVFAVAPLDVMFRVSMPAAVNVPAVAPSTVKLCESAVPETTAAAYVRVRSAVPAFISAATRFGTPLNVESPFAVDPLRLIVSRPVARARLIVSPLAEVS